MNTRTYSEKIDILHALIALSLCISKETVVKAYQSQEINPHLTKNQITANISTDIIKAIGGDIDGDKARLSLAPEVGEGFWMDFLPRGRFYVPHPEETITTEMLKEAYSHRQDTTSPDSYYPAYIAPAAGHQPEAVSIEADWRSLRNEFWAIAQVDPRVMQQYEEQVLDKRKAGYECS